MSDWPPAELEGFPPGSIVEAKILAILVPRIEELASRTGRSPFAVLNAALGAGLCLMGAPAAGTSDVWPTKIDRADPGRVGVIPPPGNRRCSHRRLEDRGPQGGGSFRSEGGRGE